MPDTPRHTRYHFRRNNPRPIKLTYVKFLRGQSTHHQASLPILEGISRDEGRTAYPDRWRPGIDRRSDPAGGMILRDAGAIVVDTDGILRPAIMATLADDIDLIATLWAMLMLPDLAGDRMDSQSLWIADTISISSSGSRLPGEDWIICRNTAGICHPVDLSPAGSRIGCIPVRSGRTAIAACSAFADTQPKQTGTIEEDTRPVMTVPGIPASGRKDRLNLLRNIPLNFEPHQAQLSAVTGARRCI